VDDVRALGLPTDTLLTVRNPLREEESKLRPSLLPGLLGSLRHNLSYGSEDVGLVEVGSVFSSEQSTWDSRLPAQPERVAWAIMGDVGTRVLGSRPIESDGRVSLGLLRLLNDVLGLDLTTRTSSPPGFHPGRTAAVLLDGVLLGFVGELGPAAARHYGLPGRVAVGELDLEPLLSPPAPKPALSPSVYPHVDFDLSFRVDESVTATQILEVTTAVAGAMLEQARVFDEFHDESLGAGKKALAITYRLRAFDRTLTSEEIAGVRRTMIDEAAGIGAELRGA
jgi:phenylalanyl-tRNA synthetase beta chain